MSVTIQEFMTFAKDCKTKAELSSLAKSNGIALSKTELNALFQKISDGNELNDDTLASAAGGGDNAYGIKLDELIK